MTDDWKIQLSLKTHKGTLINLRANSGGELDGQMEYLASRIGAILAAEQELAAAGTVAAAIPLAPPAQQAQVPQAPPAPAPNQWQQQPQTFANGAATWGAPQSSAPLPAPSQPVPYPQGAPDSPAGVSGAAPSPAQQPGHVCLHGMPAKYVPGGVSKTGKAYRAFYACPLDRDQQCKYRADA